MCLGERRSAAAKSLNHSSHNTNALFFLFLRVLVIGTLSDNATEKALTEATTEQQGKK
jgi:hypothetical protein